MNLLRLSEFLQIPLRRGGAGGDVRGGPAHTLAPPYGLFFGKLDIERKAMPQAAYRSARVWGSSALPLAACFDATT